MSQYLTTGNCIEIEVTEKNHDNLLKSILSTRDDNNFANL